jgi:hypothetical protein
MDFSGYDLPLDVGSGQREMDAVLLINTYRWIDIRHFAITILDAKPIIISFSTQAILRDFVLNCSATKI